MSPQADNDPTAPWTPPSEQIYAMAAGEYMGLKSQLESTLVKINIVMDRLEYEASRMNIAVTDMRNKDGSFMIVDVLLARSNTLNALVTLKALEAVKR